MRAVTCLLSSGAIFSLGCSDICGAPTQINNIEYDSFVNARAFSLSDEDGFPAEGCPVNGPLAISFEWASELGEGPLTVRMDGQAFEGSGTWSQMDCGNFQASWEGTYEGSDGSRHTFVAAAAFVVWESTNLEGFIEWDENWTSAEGVQGEFAASALLRGSSSPGASETP